MATKKATSTRTLLHPACRFVRELDEREYTTLKTSIENQGQLHAIETYEGKVIDGRHRLRICKELKIKPKLKEIAPALQKSGIDPYQYTADLAGAGRQMNVSERALMATALAERLGKKKGVTKRAAQTKAAKAHGVSEGSMSAARTVKKSGTEKEVEAVKSGKTTVHKAARKIKEEGRDKSTNNAKAKAKPKARAKTSAKGDMELQFEHHFKSLIKLHAEYKIQAKQGLTFAKSMRSELSMSYTNFQNWKKANQS